ncbi:uncharacterized protein LOC123516194 isoform X2 [Portunus trituberculatus]|nr:uncharacterized protein LOC123516194 isoform X2 [Portunus trituberculatus]XP_045131319.1 uncharacterized protein LOC123516194 isoform X2 [Portunus trituberculatus]
MTTKQKLSRKRGNEHLRDITSNFIEASEITISRSKRRKNGNSEIVNTGNQEAVETQIQSYSQVAPLESQQKCSNKQTYFDSRKTFSIIDASSTEKCVRNRYKNTYASLSKAGLLSNQIKNKQYIGVSNVVLIKTTNDVEHKSDRENNKGKETPKLPPDFVNRSLTLSNDMQITNSDKLSCSFTQVIDSNSILKNEKGCLIYVQSPSFPNGKTRKTNEESCPQTIKPDQFAEPECLKEKCNTLDSVISTELVSHVNHSKNPVLKPVAKVSSISTTSSVQTLSASTSAITAISTPIPTFPKLPDVFGDMLKSEAEYLGQTTITSGRKDVCSGRTPQEMVCDAPGCISVEISKQNNSSADSCNQNVHHNQQIVFPLRCTEPSTSVPLPVVDILGESYNSCMKEDNVRLGNDVSGAKTKIHALGTIMSGSLEEPSFLQVDTWATHILQNLELLYKNETQCDFILKFCGGEVLKVHRTVLLACTSLVAEADTVLGKNELMVPADLNFASVEPVIRFVYSGRLEIQKSADKMSAIYTAAKRLEVSLLIHIMDHHFPYLQYNFYSLTSIRDSKKQIENKKQFSTETTSFDTLLSKDFPQSPLQGKPATSKNTIFVENEQDFNSKTIQETIYAEKVDMEECETPDPLVHYLVTNSRNHFYTTSSPGRSSKITEEARPTRFQLEEDSEKLSYKAAAWSTKNSPTSSPDVPFTLTTSNLTYTPISSPSLVGCTSSETCSSTTTSTSQVFKNCLSSSDVKVKKENPHFICNLSHESQIIESISSSNQNLGLGNDINAPTECDEYDSVADIHDDYHTKGNELMEKVSSICKQLEEKDSNYVNGLHDTNIKGKKSNEKFNLLSINNTTCSKETSLTKGNLMSNAIIPVKSILKKNKNKSHANKEIKHVSFQMDENNELINEVATFSLSKEPAQSLIQVQKTKGNTKLRNDTHSPVKLTVSMKKKVLMNLALNESETVSSSNVQVKRSHGKKGVSSSSQGYSKCNVNKGDITSHAKIISEVLKKYPHLVKDKKKIRLKILKKGNEKDGGGKMKSKVQYLVLSDGDAKSKSVTKVSKTSSLSKHDMTTVQTALSERSFECPECTDMTFKSYFLLKKHVFLSHKDKSNAILSRTENVPYACYKCFANEPLEFENYYTYQQHMGEVHSKTELRLCNICGFKPRRKIELAYHQHTQHNKISKSFCFPKCDLCDHIAINDAALLKHRSQHRNADNYTCSVCGVKFCSFGALQGHMQTKLCQTKPSVSHKCPHCPMTFARSYNLKAHCKSSHKSLQTTLQSTSGAKEMQSQDLTSHSAESQSQEAERGSHIIKTNSDSNYEKDNTNAEVNYETLTVVDTQSSSEAEALSTVASSLVASLRLPEETINQYMYSQDNKMDYSNTVDQAKVEQVISKPLGLSVHLEIPSVSEYQDQSQCYDKPYSIQTSIQDNTSINPLFPISVVPNEVLPSIIPRHIVPNNILQAGCMHPTSTPVLGAASQSWTYVTYQVPTSSDDLPGVLTETTSINDSSGDPHHSTNIENVYHSTSTAIVENITMTPSNINCTESAMNMSGEHTTVTITDTQTTRNLSQTSSLPVAHTYDSLSSQFV